MGSRLCSVHRGRSAGHACTLPSRTNQQDSFVLCASTSAMVILRPVVTAFAIAFFSCSTQTGSQFLCSQPSPCSGMQTACYLAVWLSLRRQTNSDLPSDDPQTKVYPIDGAHRTTTAGIHVTFMVRTSTGSSTILSALFIQPPTPDASVGCSNCSANCPLSVVVGCTCSQAVGTAVSTLLHADHVPHRCQITPARSRRWCGACPATA